MVEIGNAQPLLATANKVLPGSYVVGVVFLSLFSDYSLLTIIVPIVPALLSERGIPDSWILVLFSSKAILQIMVNPFVGLLVDRFGSRMPLAAALLILSVSTVAFGAALEIGPHNDAPTPTPTNGTAASFTLAPTTESGAWQQYGCLIAARAIQGMASGVIMAAGMAWISKVYGNGEGRGSATGIAQSGVALGVLCGAPLGGVIAHYSHNWVPFAAIACVVVVSLFLLLLIICGVFGARAPSPSTGDAARPKPPLCKFPTIPRQAYIIAIGVMTANSCIAVLEVIVPLYLNRTFFLGPRDQGLIFGISTVGYLVATPVAGYASDKWCKWSLMSAGMLVLGEALSNVGSLRWVAW
jgi:DHA1 family solute carrier family 18 vesicular amine transporter 1/2